MSRFLVRLKPNTTYLVVLVCAVVGLAIVASAIVRGAIVEAVRIDSGLVAGTTGSRAAVRVFKGIPFAAPPVGDLRWREPRPVTGWDGVRKADQFGNVCVQPHGVGRLNVSVDLPGSPRPSEDCLYLNVGPQPLLRRNADR